MSFPTDATRRARRVFAACALTLAALAACAIASHQARARTSPAGAAASASNGPIAFMRFAGSREDDRTPQIFTRSPAGSVRQLTHVVGGAFDPQWSPDGSRIAFGRLFSMQRQPDQLYTIEADGSDVRPLTTGCTAADCLGDDFPAYSPDGSQIAFVRRTSRWSAPAARTSRRRPI